jgi:hypothetical protein
MNPIEPNIVALGWFAAFWSVCCLGFLQLAGMYPLHPRRAPFSPLLTIGASMLWLAMLAGTCLFAYAELRLTTAIVSAGLLFLFLPELFQSLPLRWRDSPGGVVVTAAILCSALLLLFGVGATPIASLFKPSV